MPRAHATFRCVVPLGLIGRDAGLCPPTPRWFVLEETMFSSSPKEGRMKYALLINLKPGAWEALSEQEREAVSGEYTAIAADPNCLGGEQLEGIHTATTVRVQDGQTLTTDGPFADTKEIFGGYYVFQADDLDKAIDVAARVPAARMGGSVEVRPVVER
jgi:hypothetical protein